MMSNGTSRVILIAVCLLIFGATTVAQSAERPNIVFILADDMGYGDPGCYNPESKIPTPNINRLASQGMRFRDAHTPTSVCTPTRYALLTGRYCWRTWLKKRVLSDYGTPLIKTNRVTLPEMLRDHGYATACVGKWHLGLGWQRNDGKTTTSHAIRVPEKVIDLSKPFTDGPCTHGFDSYFGTNVPNHPPFCFLKNDRVFGPIPDRQKPKNMFGHDGLMQKDWKLERILPTLGEKATAYIRRQSANEPDRPFFLYLPLTAPHTPIVPNKPFRGSTKATLYGDFVAEVDSIVGDVLKAIDETGLADRTIVVFTSDNGSPGRNGKNASGSKGSCFRDSGHNPSGPWRGRKGDIFEGGHRVPLIVRWPGRVQAGCVSDELICLVDFYATVAAMLGHQLPADAAEDSFNMLPVLLDKSLPGPIRDSVIHHSAEGMFALRSGAWKYIRGQGSGSHYTKVKVPPDAPKGQLYNMANDPGETNNLYNKRPDVVERLSKMLDRQMKAGRTRH